MKFKWFRHRLTFDQIATDPLATSGDRYKRSHHDHDSSSVVVTGYYRKSVDIDDFVAIQRPSVLPPIKTKRRAPVPELPPPRRNHHIAEEAQPVDESLVKSLDNVTLTDIPPPLPTSPVPKLEEDVEREWEIQMDKLMSDEPIVVENPIDKTGVPVETRSPKATKSNGARQHPKENKSPSLPSTSNSPRKHRSPRSPSRSQETRTPKIPVQSERPAAPKVIRIGETTPPPIQKPSKLRSLFGFSSGPEPPKPTPRRIRVPKQSKGAVKPSPVNTSNAIIAQASGSSKSTEEKSPKLIEKVAKSNTSPPPAYSYNDPLRIVASRKQTTEPSESSETIFPKVQPKSQPKQLSFAETATVYSDAEPEEDQHDDVNQLNSASAATPKDDDSWDLVAKHRASISQNAQQMKVPLKKPVTNTTERRVEFEPVAKPKTMREMRKSQSVGAGVNLKNKAAVKEAESDTEA